jgi:tRNA pseudouridine55 synthase
MRFFMINIISSGFLLINKPAGISSYGCIGYLKRILKQKVKIGHAGTLDPFATGLLIVAIGREATRLMSRVMMMEKTYIATGKCGELTDTLDYTGKIISTCVYIPTQQEICNSIASFGSSYIQIPPLYSALKHNGERLYALARNNSNVQELQEIAASKSRTVQLYDLRLLSYKSPQFTIQARVSHGTYIRTLVNDIAIRACPPELVGQSKAGSCATTYQLKRTAIGPFDLNQATDLETIHSIEDINRLIIPFSLFL